MADVFEGLVNIFLSCLAMQKHCFCIYLIESTEVPQGFRSQS